jgi:hypothetical protein
MKVFVFILPVLIYRLPGKPWPYCRQPMIQHVITACRALIRRIVLPLTAKLC